MAKKFNLLCLNENDDELVELHQEKVRSVVSRVEDMYLRGVLNDAQADTYTRELQKVEINSDRLDQIGKILEQVEQETVNGTAQGTSTAVSNVFQ